ncbi:MAG: helix-turn-helix domain-containing protein [Bacteroidetes bacterium]|nr:helix-turn-helix domain-containing protein [Bacteroidota bacterium]
MNPETAYPVNPLLKKYIDYYYFLKSDDPEFTSSYYFFPNTNHALNLHRNVDVTISEKSVRIQESAKNNCVAILQGKYQEPLMAELSGRLDKVTIVFKPLGICHFLDEPFHQVAPFHSQLFTKWNQDPAYLNLLDHFFATTDTASRVNFLESYLLQRFHHFEEYEFLSRAIQHLQNREEQLSVQQIADKLAVSSRTLNRLFTRHVGISPASYRKIAQFRHSLRNKLFATRFKKLTEIGYESDFYDQAYFSKVYRKITGVNPNLFFKSIEQLADNNLVFRFVKK